MHLTHCNKLHAAEACCIILSTVDIKKAQQVFGFYKQAEHSFLQKALKHALQYSGQGQRALKAFTSAAAQSGYVFRKLHAKLSITAVPDEIDG